MTVSPGWATEAALLIVRYGAVLLPRAESLPDLETCICRANVCWETRIDRIRIGVSKDLFILASWDSRAIIVFWYWKR